MILMNMNRTAHLGVDRSEKRGHDIDGTLHQRRLVRNGDESPRLHRSRGDVFERSNEIEHYNNYDKSGIHVDSTNNNDVPKTKNVLQRNEMLVIDMRRGENDITSPRLMDRYPHDENDEWEIIRVHYDENGIPNTIHKRPPEHLQNILIYRGPLEVRREMFIHSVSYNRDGIRTGYMSKGLGLIDPARLAADIQLHRSEMARIDAYLEQGIKDYIDGKIGADEVTKIIETMYKDLLSLSIALGNTDGNDPEINAEILRSAQGKFIHKSLTINILANNEEGAAIARSKGLTHINDSFEYYNAKFFHANKELQEIGRVALTQIAKKEGLDSFDYQNYFKWHHANICFNVIWNSLGTMKDVNIQPPKDFIMFHAPRLYSFNDYDDWFGGSDSQLIIVNDPTRTDGHGSWNIYVPNPRGWQLFKSLPLWLTHGTFTDQEGRTFITWDITHHIKFNPGDDMQSRIMEFFKEYINDPLHGELTIWSNGKESVHNVPFCLFGDGRRLISGGEIPSAVEHNSFIKNFEFRAMF